MATQKLEQDIIDDFIKKANESKQSIDNLAVKYSKMDITNYDFRRPNRISKNQVRTLLSIHENFAELFSYHLVTKLQTTISINNIQVDQLFYSEYISSVVSPSCLYVFEIAGTDGSGILEISSQLALMIVERLLGGNAETLPNPRGITTIEQAVIRSIMEHSFTDLKTAWKSITDHIGFKYQRLEQEAEFVQIAPSSEIVIVISFDVHVGQHTFLMNLCFPTFALEEILAKLNRQQVTTAANPQSKKKIKENIMTVNQQISTTYLPVVAELGKTAITVTELMELKVGDILKTERRIDQEIEIIIAGKRKLAARPGVVDGKKAARIIRPLGPDDMYEQDVSYK